MGGATEVEYNYLLALDSNRLRTTTKVKRTPVFTLRNMIVRGRLRCLRGDDSTRLEREWKYICYILNVGMASI